MPFASGIRLANTSRQDLALTNNKTFIKSNIHINKKCTFATNLFQLIYNDNIIKISFSSY